jgi:hypothetical protein
LGGKTAGRPAFLALTCHEFVNVVQRDESKAIVPFAEPFEKSNRSGTVAEYCGWSEPTSGTHRIDKLRYQLLERVGRWNR